MPGSLRWVKFLISCIQYIVVISHNQNYTCDVHLALPLITVDGGNIFESPYYHHMTFATCHFKEFSLYFHHKEKKMGFGVWDQIFL